MLAFASVIIICNNCIAVHMFLEHGAQSGHRAVRRRGARPSAFGTQQLQDAHPDLERQHPEARR